MRHTSRVSATWKTFGKTTMLEIEDNGKLRRYAVVNMGHTDTLCSRLCRVYLFDTWLERLELLIKKLQHLPAIIRLGYANLTRKRCNGIKNLKGGLHIRPALYFWNCLSCTSRPQMCSSVCIALRSPLRRYLRPSLWAEHTLHKQSAFKTLARDHIEMRFKSLALGFEDTVEKIWSSSTLHLYPSNLTWSLEYSCFPSLRICEIT